MYAYPPVLKRLLLLFLVSLVGTIGLAQSEKGIEPQWSSPSPGSGVPTPKNYALMVGISCYEYLDWLRYAHKDALDIAQFLRKEFGKEIEIDIFLDKQAKADTIRQWLTDKMVLGEELKGSKIYLLLSGHAGSHDSNTKFGYFCPVGYDPKTGVSVGKNVINMKFLWDCIRSYIEAGALVTLLVDACHAEGFHPNKLKEVVLAWPKNNKSATFLATLEDQKAIEPSNIENGILVYHFIKGTTDELQKDGKAQVFEMREYLRKAVPRTAAQHNHIQTPLVIGDRALVVAERPAVVVTNPIKLPQNFQSPTIPIQTIAPYNPRKNNHSTSTDSLQKTHEQLQQHLRKKDWKGAYQLLERYKLTDNYKRLRNAYVSACHEEAEDLSVLLAEFYEKYEFAADSIRLSLPVNQRRDSLNQQIDILLYDLRRCLNLLPTTDPYYFEIKYRTLVFEGHRENSIKELEEAIIRNPDFEYVHVILIRILMEQGLPIKGNILVPPRISNNVQQYNVLTLKLEEKRRILAMHRMRSSYKNEQFFMNFKKVPKRALGSERQHYTHNTSKRKKAIIWWDEGAGSNSLNRLISLSDTLRKLNYSTQLIFGSFEVYDIFMMEFSSSINSKDTVVLYISGHDLEANYMSLIADEIAKKTNNLTLFVDRNEPLNDLFMRNPLRPENIEYNTFIVQTRNDGLFAEVLLEEICNGNQGIQEIFDNVKAKIRQKEPYSEIAVYLNPKIPNPVYFKK